MNKYAEYNRVMEFIKRLEKETKEGSILPMSYLYHDEFELMKKFVRSAYYGDSSL